MAPWTVALQAPLSSYPWGKQLLLIFKVKSLAHHSELLSLQEPCPPQSVPCSFRTWFPPGLLPPFSAKYHKSTPSCNMSPTCFVMLALPTPFFSITACVTFQGTSLLLRSPSPAAHSLSFCRSWWLFSQCHYFLGFCFFVLFGLSVSAQIFQTVPAPVSICKVLHVPILQCPA